MAIFITLLSCAVTLAAHFCRAIRNAEPLSNPSNSILEYRTSMNKLTAKNLSQRWAMLWTLFIVLLVLWLVGVVSSYMLGGFIHILLVLAVLALIFQLVTSESRA